MAWEDDVVRNIDAAIHGDMEPLFGDTIEQFWNFVRESLSVPQNEGILVRIPMGPEEEPWNLWLVWRFDKDTIVNEGVYLPSEACPDLLGKPEGFEDWPDFTVTPQLQ